VFSVEFATAAAMVTLADQANYKKQFKINYADATAPDCDASKQSTINAARPSQKRQWRGWLRAWCSK
jgi:hypothetical protein